MVFVCLGTQTYPFDRLLKGLDILIEKNIVTEDIFAQVGTLNYIPKHFKYVQFMSHEEFDEKRKKASLIISHGGTGALIGASKLGKNIVAVPRLSKFGEHVDDHQLQIVSVLESEGYIRAVYDIDDLGKTILEALSNPITKVYERKSSIVKIITDYLENN